MELVLPFSFWWRKEVKIACTRKETGRNLAWDLKRKACSQSTQNKNGQEGIKFHICKQEEWHLLSCGSWIWWYHRLQVERAHFWIYHKELCLTENTGGIRRISPLRGDFNRKLWKVRKERRWNYNTISRSCSDRLPWAPWDTANQIWSILTPTKAQRTRISENFIP